MDSGPSCEIGGGLSQLAWTEHPADPGGGETASHLARRPSGASGGKPRRTGDHPAAGGERGGANPHRQNVAGVENPTGREFPASTRDCAAAGAILAAAFAIADRHAATAGED